VPEGIGAPVESAGHPSPDSPFADAQRLGDLALRPALLLEMPGLESLGFFPVVMIPLMTRRLARRAPLRHPLIYRGKGAGRPASLPR
jgi:hypothetical protein